MNQDEQLLNGLKQVILDNLENEQFSVEHLSQLVGVSRSHLHRKLKKLKGQSISQFIREVRLTEALKMLRKDVATVSEIAYKVGFNSPSYFHKCFLEYYGYPPGDVKQRFQNSLKNTSEDEAYVDPQIVFKAEKKQNSKIKKTIAFSIIAFLFIAYSAIYFLKKGTDSLPLEKSIAVLPFNNLSADEENRYFADGLVEDLLNRLALIDEFKVISRTSSDTYRERGKKKVTKIASELGVSYIVEGSVQKYDNKARITIQLIDAKNDKHIWTDSYDKDLADVFKIQSEIAMQVASGLSFVLTEQQTQDIQKNRTENVKAFELYLLGRFYWGKRTEEGYSKAIHYFEQAIAEDSDYALAYAGLADTYFLRIWGISDAIKISTYRNKAEELALKTLSLDESLAEAHTVLATLYFFIDWDWLKAEKMFIHAFEFNPNYSTLHHRYSEHLSITGRHEEARKHINKAIELDPLSFIVRSVSAKLYINQGLFQEALKETQISQELNDDNARPIFQKLLINYELGYEALAYENLKKLERIYDSPLGDFLLDSIYNVSGLDNLIRWKIESYKGSGNDNGLKRWKIESPYSYLHKAKLYSFLGENDKAMDWLELAFIEGDRLPDVPYWYSSNDLHSNPRFITLMKKMNLPWEPDSAQ